MVKEDTKNRAPKRVRSEWLEPRYAESPELFPPGFDEYYEMAGHYTSKRQNIKIRRITLAAD